MISLDLVLMSLGGILFLALLSSLIDHNTACPKVTMLLAIGVILGPELFDVVPEFFSLQLEAIATVTLTMAGFVVGGKLDQNVFRGSAKTAICISLAAVLITCLFVAGGLIWFSVDTPLAILLGVISAATAPAAILKVVKQSTIENAFTKSLVSISALDDVWALLCFALALDFLSKNTTPSSDLVLFYHASINVLGAISLGAAIGCLVSYFSRLIKSSKLRQLKALSALFVCGGLALYVYLSYVLATIIMGAIVASFAKQHRPLIDAVKDLESIFLVVLYVLAGASLELDTFVSLSFVGAAYIASRCVGKYLGAWLGSRVAQAQESTIHWMRYALLPQAGISISMAVVASVYFPQYQQMLLTLVVGSMAFFEIVGPLYTRLAMQRAMAESSESEAEQ